MTNKSLTSSMNYSRAGEGLTMVQRMKEEADYYTRMEQLQKHQRQSLNTIYFELSDKVKALKLSIAKLEKDVEMGNDKRANIKIKNLQKDIEINDKKKNDTLGDIDRTKKIIDMKRQEQTLLRKNIKIAQDEISKLHDEMDKLSKDIQHAEINSKTSQNLMLDLKSDNEEDKLYHTKKFNNLNINLYDSKMSSNSIGLDKRLKKSSSQIKGIVIDTSSILKRKLMKLIKSNKNKIKLIEMYQKNMRIIQDAFDNISQSTGITDIQEIEATFIKGEQQNYSLLTYVDVLDQEIDIINDQNKSMEEKIQKLKKFGKVYKNQIKQNQSNLEQKEKLTKLDQNISSKKEAIKLFETFLKTIQPSFEKLIINLTKSKFNQNRNNNQSLYELSGVSLNENTLDQYLDQVEDYTNQILFYKGKEMGKTNSEIFAKSLLLDQLDIKQYKKRIMEPMSPKEMMIDDPDTNKELLTELKLAEIAVKEIERYKVFGNQDRLKK